MDTFRDTAFYLTLWHAFLAGLCTVLLIVLNDLDPATAFLIAANIALLFALTLMARAGRLNVRRITHGMFWRTLPPAKRPAGEAGLRLACRALGETWLQFAKGAAVAAIALSSLAWASNGAGQAAWAKAVRAHGMAQAGSHSNSVTAYRAGRLLPTN